MQTVTLAPMPPTSRPQPPENQSSVVYSPQEVQEILNLAIARQMADDTLSHTQLLEIAQEMGIDATELAIAEQDWRLMQGAAAERLEFDRYRKARFQRRLTRYSIVNSFLAAIALLSSGGTSLMGVPFILLGWGLFVVLDGWNVYWVKGDRYESAFQSWRRRRQLKRSVSSLLNRLLG